VAAVGLALVLVLAGCSDDDPGAGGSDGDPAISVVSINLLHGTACPEDSNRCDLPARAELFAAQLEEGGCPELVSVQEGNQETIAELEPHLGDVCDGEYEVVSDEDQTLDREFVLSTVPVVESRRIDLAGPLRTGFWVRAATDVGVVDYVSTHLASGSDDRPCDANTCPPPCEADDTLNTCQGRQVVAFADDIATDDSVVVLGGDLNARPDEPTIAAVTDAGYLDTHVEAGNPECDPETGEQCTSGRIDDEMTDLEDPDSIQTERIDYLFVGGERDCAVVDPTGLFNPGPADGPLAHPSDHTGVEATLACATSAEQEESATTATAPPEATTTTTAGAAVDAETEDAITQAFTNLFDGTVTDIEVKLSSLERAEEVREYFIEMYEEVQEVASGIRVRIDSITAVDDTHADVTYSLLLDGAPVLDHLPGAAVEVDGEWLVTLQTYCDVSTQGAETIPPPCQ
jgi:endonuclease/exonuclease/phosphatase family metal-dependent hydrolase